MVSLDWYLIPGRSVFFAVVRRPYGCEGWIDVPGDITIAHRCALVLSRLYYDTVNPWELSWWNPPPANTHSKRE